jgi:hypothetical protein
MTEPDASGLDADQPRTLEAVITALRRLAVAALDAGEPIAAARIASTADRLDAEAWPPNPPRPEHRRAK